MAYDKKSFLAGISVGTQLKGWATGPGATLVPHNFRNVVMLKLPQSVLTTFTRAEITSITAILIPEITPVTDFIEEEGS